jgi:hypothetical protein
MEGVIVGLDWSAALASLSGDLDRDMCKRLMAALEQAYVSAALDLFERNRKKD